MNTKYFVPYETAIKLKEKSYPQEDEFDNSDFYVYVPDYDEVYHVQEAINCGVYKSSLLTVPTYQEVIDWIELKIKDSQIRIEGHFGFNSGSKYYMCRLARPYLDDILTPYCETRELALEKIILKALELI